jgi:hypothetical protein
MVRRYIQWIWTACHWLAMSNCCYNPIVYCWMNAKFRAGFRHIFRCCPFICPDNSNSASSQMTSYTDAYSAAGGRRRYYSSATVSCSVVMTTGFDEHEQKSPFVTRKQIGGSLTSAAGRASVGHSPTGDCYALCRVEE